VLTVEVLAPEPVTFMRLVTVVVLVAVVVEVSVCVGVTRLYSSSVSDAKTKVSATKTPSKAFFVFIAHRTAFVVGDIWLYGSSEILRFL